MGQTIAQEPGQSSSNRGVGWISGNPYYINRREGVATRTVSPGVACPEAHVTAPHPDPRLRRWGWRIAFVFFLFACWGCALVVMFHAELAALSAK